MEFHAAMETFAEAWIAANLQNYSTTDETQNMKTDSSNASIISDEQVPMSEPRMATMTKLARRNPATTKPGNAPFSYPGTTMSALGIRSYPIHCLVEQETRERSGDVTSNVTTTVICDSYAILPGSLLFTDIVRAALVKIGFSVTEAIGAKGMIQIRNWKSIPFEMITDNSKNTVEEILGEVASALTLRIRLNSVDLDKLEWTDQAVRCTVVKLLKDFNQISLAKICPLPQSMISNIANSKYTARICPEKCREFGEWYRAYRRDHKETCTGENVHLQINKETDTVEEVPNASPNTRMTFHPIYELPLMRQWYKLCNNPTNDEFKRYLDELNNAPVRQERTKVPMRRLKIWWRNEKQRVKKHEIRILEGKPIVAWRRRSKLKANAETSTMEPALENGEAASGKMECGDALQKQNAATKRPDRPVSTDRAFSGDGAVGSSRNSCYQTSSGNAYPNEVNSPPVCQQQQQHRPVYVNSPSESGFHVRYLDEQPAPPRAHLSDNNLTPGGSSRCHPPLFGLNLPHQPQPMGSMNPHVYHLTEGLYTPPVFHPCSISSSGHPSP